MSVQRNGLKISPLGTGSQLIQIMARKFRDTTSCIFGGPDLGVLYITTSRQNMTPEQLGRYSLSGSVFAVRPGLSGVPEPRFAE